MFPHPMKATHSNVFPRVHRSLCSLCSYQQPSVVLLELKKMMNGDVDDDDDDDPFDEEFDGPFFLDGTLDQTHSLYAC